MTDGAGESALRGLLVDVHRARPDGAALQSHADPRVYFETVDRLDCVTPRVAQPIIAQLIDARLRSKGGPITLVELGCGYGVNGALVKYGFSFELLRERYASPSIEKLAAPELLALDRHFSAAWPARRDVRVIGIDPSPAAVRYAESCGYIDVGLVADLDADNLTNEDAARLAGADLIVSTGSFGRISRRTFDKLAEAGAGRTAPWVASFVSRSFNYQRIAKTLRRYGLITERFEGATFVQRRFRNEHEMRATLHTLQAHGVNPAGKESQGRLHAELFLSRPWTDIESEPLAGLISVPGDPRRRASSMAAVRPRIAVLRTPWASSPHVPQ